MVQYVQYGKKMFSFYSAYIVANFIDGEALAALPDDFTEFSHLATRHRQIENSDLLAVLLKEECPFLGFKKWVSVSLSFPSYLPSSSMCVKGGSSNATKWSSDVTITCTQLFWVRVCVEWCECVCT